MAWYDNLFTPTMTPERQAFLDAAGQSAPVGDMGQAALDGLLEGVTDPNTYLEAIAMVPGARGAVGTRPNWVWGGAGKGGRGAPSWRWGSEGMTPPVGPPKRGGGALPPPGGKGGLPATQGGLPATQGGPLAKTGGPLATRPLSDIKLPQFQFKPGMSQVDRTALGAAGLGAALWGLDALGPDEEQTPGSGIGGSAGSSSSASASSRSRPWDALVDRGYNIAGGDSREFQSLPTIDYEGLTRPDYDATRKVLSETGPVAPVEESFFQKLDDWLVPALAFGMLGGLPGAIAGGLMGEGTRQDKESSRTRDYQEAVNEDQRAIADWENQVSTDIRNMDLTDAQGEQQQVMDQYKFGADQRTERRNEAQFVDNRASQALQNILSQMQIAQTGLQMDYQDQMLNGGMASTQPDNSQLLESLVQANPAILEHPAFQSYMQNMQLGLGTNDKLTTAARMQELVWALQQDPQYSPIIEQLMQQQAMSDLGSIF